MNYLYTVILGLVQGIAEFLPISSSAHLIIFRDIFGIGKDLFVGELEQSFDIALHFGTLLAILVYFFKDFLNMIINGFKLLFAKKKMNLAELRNGKMLWMIFFATIPAAIFGLIFDEKVEEMTRGNYILIACALAIMGIIIYFTDRFSKNYKDFNRMGYKEAILIGFAQVLALIPGFSRSGTTIAMARLLKVNRSDAAKFSFYLSAPVVFGAVLIKLIKGEIVALITYNVSVFLIGIGVSFIVGLLCIKFLLKYLKKHGYNIFMWYRLLMALAILIVLYMR